ncbi:DUF2624 domain-containing protein [Sporolactobacillus sp. THM7-4]|nr:DUF2624 domain-containing protein [Sporolactobacillus sp. THM7-4]
MEIVHPMIQQIVNQRVNQVSADELYQYAGKYGIPITKNQAARIASRVHGKNIDLFSLSGQSKLQKILSEEIGPQLASELKKRFEQLVGRY